MSASEAFCLIRNIGVIAGDLIPPEDRHWKLIILIKKILDIVIVPFFHEHIPDHLNSLIEDYLVFRNELFPKSMKLKHHLLIHYPSVLKRFGPLGAIATMLPESKNRDSKMYTHISLCRKDLTKSAAVKGQLRLSHRIRKNKPPSAELYKIESYLTVLIHELPKISSFFKLLPFQIND